MMQSLKAKQYGIKEQVSLSLKSGVFYL